MLRVLLLLVFVPVAALLTWLSLGPRGERADFVVASDALRTIDPHRVSWLDEIQVAAALFEGLTRLHPETMQPEPGVAATWCVSDDALRFTFHLRENARWSNGDGVTARDFRFGWLRVLDPKVEAQYASLLFVIDGAEAYYRSRLDDDSRDDRPAESVGIEVFGDHTLRVQLAGPCSYFLDLTSFPTLAPAHRPTLERWAYRAGVVRRATRHLWTRPANIVCNGAFVLTQWDFKRSLWLRRNTHYWDRASIPLDSLEIYIAGDPNAALVAYETGRVDLVRGLAKPVARELRKRQLKGEREDFHLGDRFATYFFRVNCKRPPLDNADLRKALALAIDKDALARRVLGLGETPADSYVPRGALELMPRPAPDGSTIFYDPPAGLGAGLPYAARVKRAREFLHASGFDRIADTRPIELAYASHPPIQKRIAEAVQSMWESALGLRVELRVMERKVLSTRIRNLDYDVVRSDWYGDYLDPGTFLDMFTSGSGQNRTGWENVEYDHLIAAAAREADNAKRFALFRAAERILCEEELPIIPLFFKRGNYLLNPRFGGVRDNVRDILPIHRVRLAVE